VNEISPTNVSILGVQDVTTLEQNTYTKGNVQLIQGKGTKIDTTKSIEGVWIRLASGTEIKMTVTASTSSTIDCTCNDAALVAGEATLVVRSRDGKGDNYMPVEVAKDCTAGAGTIKTVLAAVKTICERKSAEGYTCDCLFMKVQPKVYGSVDYIYVPFSNALQSYEVQTFNSTGLANATDDLISVRIAADEISSTIRISNVMDIASETFCRPRRRFPLATTIWRSPRRDWSPWSSRTSTASRSRW